jgi:succinyl-CoA synthetase beta subunit
MSQYGINVPPGIPVSKIEDVAAAAAKMADKDGMVRWFLLHHAGC